jgi:hypothetical protein
MFPNAGSSIVLRPNRAVGWGRRLQAASLASTGLVAVPKMVGEYPGWRTLLLRGSGRCRHLLVEVKYGA